MSLNNEYPTFKTVTDAAKGFYDAAPTEARAYLTMLLQMFRMRANGEDEEDIDAIYQAYFNSLTEEFHAEWESAMDDIYQQE